MIRQTVSALVLAAATLAPIASHATSLFGTTTTTAPVKLKMVKMTLKNRTSAPMDLLIDSKTVTIAANSEYELRAPEGTQVFGTDKVLKVTITRDLDGTVCSFK